jgi:5-methylcytosine-specific restriction endonuclease McrA
MSISCNPRSDLVSLVGKRYGYLVVESYAGSKRWYCVCDCGNKKTVSSGNLRLSERLNRKSSCGCLWGYKNPANRNRRVVSNDEAAIHSIWLEHRRRAHKINEASAPWNIPEPLFTSLITSPCRYCGEIGSNTHIHTYRKVGDTGEFRYNGLDRSNPQKGYTLDNVIPCCWQCNKTKGKLSHDDFIRYICRVTQHLGI